MSLLLVIVFRSSEEEELERIKNLQKEVALQRKKNEASYKAALAGSKYTNPVQVGVTKLNPSQVK